MSKKRGSYQKDTVCIFLCNNSFKEGKYMRKNNMKKPEEKEIIVKRYFCGESVAKLASEYEIGVRQIYHWINKYQENGIEGLKSNTGKCSKSHEHMGLHFRKPKNKLEELEIEIMKKDIEIARLKKVTK